MDHFVSLLQIWIPFPQTFLCPGEYIHAISREDRMGAHSHRLLRASLRFQE